MDSPRPNISEEQWREFLAAFHPLENPALVRRDLAQYLERLLKENTKLNLTSITDWNLGVWKHLYDSLLALRGEPLGVVLDWGTGGGTPGIPLAIWARHERSAMERIVLLDSVGKKTRAVASFVEGLCLSELACAVQARGEEYIAQNRVDTVVMRAVAPPERVLLWISPQVSRWVFMVGPKSLDLWLAALPGFRRAGLVLAANIKEALPQGLGDRHVLVFAKK